jgi:hypothetical protein
MTIRTFRPTMNSGILYARLAGSAAAMADIGGVAELQLAINEDIKKQTDFSKAGGGTRAQVNRVSSVELTAKLQDINPVNLSRAVFGAASSVAASTVVGEAQTAYLGGLVALAKPAPTSVVVKIGATVVAAAGNYEVRPEGVYVLATATDLADGDAITVDYAHGGFDVVQALVDAAPTLEMRFGGVNEADNGSPVIVDIFKVKLGATSGLGLIHTDFGTLDVKGEVLYDPTKTGVGISHYFQVMTTA